MSAFIHFIYVLCFFFHVHNIYIKRYEILDEEEQLKKWMSLKENLTKIKDQIRETENETKNPGKVKLVAVTKTRDFHIHQKMT